MTPGRDRRTAIIAGGSVAGLFAGSILHRDGWAVQVCERAGGSLESRGAGIAMHDELFGALRQAGARVDAMIGIQVEGRAAYDHSGAEIARYDYPQYLTSWGLLYRRLRSALPDELYHLDRTVVDVTDTEEQVLVKFSDGTSRQADLLIGADGSWSTVRALRDGMQAPSYSGYVAWRGLLDEKQMSRSFRDRYGSLLSFFVRQDQQLVCYPVAGVDDSVEPGRRRFSFLWYRPCDKDALASLLTDVDGIRHEHQIPPGRVDPRHIARMRSEAKRYLPPDFADFVARTPNPFLQPIRDLSPTRIVFHRTALIGDAASVVRPHVGAGVAKAATDATTLVDALRESQTVAEALRRYETLRLPFARAMVDRARHLGRYLEAPPGRTRAPVLPIDEIVRETARLP